MTTRPGSTSSKSSGVLVAAVITTSLPFRESSCLCGFAGDMQHFRRRQERGTPRPVSLMKQAQIFVLPLALTCAGAATAQDGSRERPSAGSARFKPTCWDSACSVRAFAFALFVALAGCARADYATVTIAYRARSQGDWNVESPARQRVASSFERIAKEQGYKCNARGKRTEEVVCVGPKRMNVTFAPELNRPLFTIHLDWVEVGDRTRAEFDGHVRQLTSAIRTAVPDAIVVTTEGREAR